MLVWFMIVAILQQAGLKTFSSHESLWAIPVSCIGIFPYFFLFFSFSFPFLSFERKERKVGRRGRPSFRKERKKKETGVQVAVLKERKGKSGVICRFINGVRYWMVKAV